MDDRQQNPPPDPGLRRLLTWTFVALVAALLISALGVYLVMVWFDHP